MDVHKVDVTCSACLQAFVVEYVSSMNGGNVPSIGTTRCPYCLAAAQVQFPRPATVFAARRSDDRSIVEREPARGEDRA